MPISVNALGERLIAEMVNELRGQFLDLCQLREIADESVIGASDPIAFVEQSLMPINGKLFDGASRVDIAVRLSEQEAVPFEVKLGGTRLSKTRIGRDWLQKCRLSHGGRRICGNMMAVLERKLPEEIAGNDLRIQVSDKPPLRLTEEWFVIVKESVLQNWQGPGRPDFSDRVRFLSFERIVECYGGASRFNALVKKMLDFDYYHKWVKEIRITGN